MPRCRWVAAATVQLRSLAPLRRSYRCDTAYLSHRTNDKPVPVSAPLYGQTCDLQVIQLRFGPDPGPSPVPSPGPSCGPASGSELPRTDSIPGGVIWFAGTMSSSSLHRNVEPGKFWDSPAPTLAMKKFVDSDFNSNSDMISGGSDQDLYGSDSNSGSQKVVRLCGLRL